jgi:hypothetical protein
LLALEIDEQFPAPGGIRIQTIDSPLRMLNQVAVVPAVVSQELSYTIPRILQGNLMEKSVVPIVDM